MSEPFWSISAVERDTGIAKDTLRVWERRYRFPAPVRDENGERLYPPEQVVRLRTIRRLLDLGFRPGKIVGASDAALEALVADTLASEPGTPPASEALRSLVGMITLRNGDALRTTLQQRLLREGLQRFVGETLAPLNLEVGLAWFRGELRVSDEHLYTEQVQNVVRAAIGQHSNPLGVPRILLTTLPEESHALGLLMVEAMLVPEGACCVSLGTRTPLDDIARAAIEGAFDIVALSFSSAFPARQAIDGLNTLRTRLPDHIALWAGGQGAPAQRRLPPGITVIDRIDEAPEALRQWRARHAGE
ncbi:MerR family transcriptional regulator [Nitrogeniibacter mangrovi]|uniref:MerR family transcriptional regulator n=1 Tax=Nitrogeniibacter mangrovi TaxID=2016596 RepID=A0A6C1B0F2_9RHOO|nr:MerR family transcriptional regulator [Nitrogeniibacter mangrovi]QID17072.1 MerR family transcriptional regulator [Nitrogeniibacter mangrovi]